MDLPDQIRRLITKMENAPDFGYDDEAMALSEWTKENGLQWKWGAGDRVIVYDPSEE